jgi:hypothetical protein
VVRSAEGGLQSEFTRAGRGGDPIFPDQ